ncbi:hypothetical protein EIP86_011560 [Pleurotus ostreatoroseus]|nr:hypothetical protein EIP86_011560 [Pleurotus ostreatoroseus]
MAPSQSTPASPAPQSPPSSADGSNGPATPVSPTTVQTLALPPPVDGAPAPAAPSTASSAPAAASSAPAKRKPSRRANTAERRATHNAVERARRETLNGRFLDLAALLPNLSQIRRPSKSSIVNSSIAHIHAARRHRMLAARELRMLKGECDALRRELNEWRDRSGLPRVEEPVRGEAFQMVLSGEVEVLSAGPIEEEDGDEYGDGFGEDDFAPMQGISSMHDEDDLRRTSQMAHAAAASLMKGDANPFAHNAPNTHGLHLQTILPRPPTSAPSPMIVQSPTNVSFENPAMASMYDPPHAQMPPQFYLGAPVMSRHEEKPSWQMYGQPQQQFTPPQSSHGPANAYMLNMNMQRQAMLQGPGGNGHMYGSPIDNDDASSVGSAHSPVPGATKRERSGSMGSVGSAGSPAGSYEMGLAGAAGVPRRMGAGGAGWGEESMGIGGGMAGMGPMGGMAGMGMAGRTVSVGGGGNAQGFAAMML